MKKLKVISIIAVIMLLLCNISTTIYATTHTASEVISDGKSFISMGEGQDKISQENLKGMSNTLYNILLVAGILISIIIGMAMGIKFIMGGIEQKAEIKGMLIPYIVGNVVIFGAFAIWKIVVDTIQRIQ